ncbi:hypothetical protein LTS08_008201 [Lithohypha guttulata]|nr:hypothetical protein LTS08_008201 [Lithohypha guttulata]
MSTRRRVLTATIAVICTIGIVWRYHDLSEVPAYISRKTAYRPYNVSHTGDSHHLPQPADSHGWFEVETNLSSGVKQYTRSSTSTVPSLLWLSLTFDSQSWGKHNFHHRNVDDFLRIIPQQVQLEDVSLGLLTSSEQEYKAYIEATRAYDFAKISIILHKGFHDGPVVDRAHRQDRAVQVARRSELAKLRNFLMLRTIADEEHILWMDADVYRLDQGIVQRMIKHTGERVDVGMITARCSQGGNDNYDHNAWRGTRQGPRGWDLNEQEIKDGELAAQGQYHVPAIIKGSTNDDLVELDVVGATILYIRATLVRQGLTFPAHFVVGTRWRKDGWDGIESEGLCYNARGMENSKCMVLGGSWHVEHTKG